MAVTFGDYINYMQNPTSVLRPIARFELLNPDETSYASFSAQVLSGTLSATRANGVRRTCELNVTNFYNDFTPNPNTFWINQKFKLSLGYVINGEEYFIPQGVFGISNPENIHIKSQKEARIVGVDKFSFLNGQLGGRVYSTYAVNSGSNLITVLKSILAESKVNDPIIPLLFIGSSVKVPYTIYKQYGSTFGDLVLELNNIVSNNMFYDVNGRFICETDVPNSEKGSVWDFRTSANTFLGITVGYNFDEAYNIILVVGDNVNGNLATGVAKNTDKSSPLSIYQIGERVAPPITSSSISNDTQAKDLAKFWLKRYVSLSSKTTITCIPLLHLDVDQIITVTDATLLLDKERFLIDSFTINLDANGNQTMSISVTKANDLDFEISDIL